MFTVVSSHHRKPLRAFVMDSGNVNSNGKIKYRLAEQPAKTVTTDSASARAFMIPASNTSSARAIEGKEPSFTVTGSGGGRVTRSFANGRVVRLSPRCLARFQAVPDWYELPKKTADAVTLIGNGVPCLLVENIGKSLMGVM